MHRICASVLLLAILGCRNTEIPGHLGRTEAEYVSRYGEPTKSPMTLDQVAFKINPETRLVVRFAGERSAEEVWIMDGDDSDLPEPLRERARRLAGADRTPARRLEFKSEGNPPKDVFEEPAGAGLLVAEQQAGRRTRVALCADRAACRLLAALQTTELSTDDWIARTAKAMREQQRH